MMSRVGFSLSDTQQAYRRLATCRGRTKAAMTTFPTDLDPKLVARLVDSGGGALAKKMGIEFVELSAAKSVARMPVEGNTQVCLLYTSDAADDLLCVDLGGRRIIK